MGIELNLYIIKSYRFKLQLKEIGKKENATVFIVKYTYFIYSTLIF